METLDEGYAFEPLQVFSAPTRNPSFLIYQYAQLCQNDEVDFGGPAKLLDANSKQS